jgi:hypothetical protein
MSYEPIFALSGKGKVSKRHLRLTLAKIWHWIENIYIRPVLVDEGGYTLSLIKYKTEEIGFHNLEDAYAVLASLHE